MLYSTYLNKKVNIMESNNHDIIDLIEILDIFDISGMNGNFQNIVMLNIKDTHKPVHELTIGELQKIIESSHEEFLLEHKEIQKLMDEFSDK